MREPTPCHQSQGCRARSRRRKAPQIGFLVLPIRYLRGRSALASDMGKPPIILCDQRLGLVAGAGFEPATFRL